VRDRAQQAELLLGGEVLVDLAVCICVQRVCGQLCRVEDDLFVAADAL
jgi:hypothetical protein